MGNKNIIQQAYEKFHHLCMAIREDNNIPSNEDDQIQYAKPSATNWPTEGDFIDKSDGPEGAILAAWVGDFGSYYYSLDQIDQEEVEKYFAITDNHEE